VREFLVIMLLLYNIITSSGCVAFMVGGAAGALGGYAVSKDTVQAETDRPYELLWDSALRVGRIRGAIKQEDRQRGNIQLEADSSLVWIRLIRLTRSTTRLRISARKYRLPNLRLAQEFFVKILEEAK
jgi:hypothetical protein